MKKPASAAKAATISGLVLVLAALAPSSARAGDDGTLEPPPKETELSSEQAAVQDVGEQVNVYADEPGYGKTIISAEAQTVTVYWRGTPPVGVSEMLGEQQNGVTVGLEDAEYADAQIQASADEVWANSDDENVTINVTYPNADLSGLIVEVSLDSSAHSSMRPARQRHYIASKLRAHSDVPMVVRLKDSVLVPRSRANDSAPWQAGGRLKNPTFQGSNLQRCTTGWAVVKPNGTGRLLSSGHCDPNAAGNLYDGADDLLSNGNNNQVAPNFDSLLIDPVNGTIAETYLGPYNSSSERRVAGGDAPSQGEEVCVSGANHGEHCHAEIIQTGAQFGCYFSPTVESCPGFIIKTTSQTGGGILGGAGDSGAPVYIRRNDGRVGARGIYTSGFNNYVTACTGEYWFNAPGIPDSQECDKRAGVVGITHLVDRWNVTVESLPAP